MCGIFSLLNNKKNPNDIIVNDDESITINNNSLKHFTDEFIYNQFMLGKNRGPEYSKLKILDDYTSVAFHRLAINGLNDISNQPLIIDNIFLICNGEIYNYKQLYQLMSDIKCVSESDCEVIIHLYMLYGIEQTLNMLDGVYAFVLIDLRNNIKGNHNIYVARDPYGVRPLYYVNGPSNITGFASELKTLINFKNQNLSLEINQFKPGSYSHLERQDSNVSKWIFNIENKCYTIPSFNSLMQYTPMIDYHLITIDSIQKYLDNAVMKRTLVTDRPIACLLSGGLDSSLITSLVNDIHKNIIKANKPLETYSIGIKGATDLVYAKKVSEYLGTKHTEIVLTEDDFFNAIPEVIKAIESYDTTTVRASIGNYLIGKYISQNSDAKVIFNGDGSDELCGGYLYMYECKDAIEFDKESRRLISNIHNFDVLRSDKCISSHGLEPRTPFLDRSWVSYYFSIHANVRFHSNKEGQIEKNLLRTSFSKNYYKNRNNEPLLPDEILWRTKEAFSDGVSQKTRSLFEIIQDKIENDKIIMKEINNIEWNKYNHNKPNTNEEKYYRYLFESNYAECGNVIPYFWMPQYVKCNDSSARKLKIYQEINDKNIENKLN